MISQATRLTCDADYETVLATKGRRDRLDEAITAMAGQCEFTPLVRRLTDAGRYVGGGSVGS